MIQDTLVRHFISCTPPSSKIPKLLEIVLDEAESKSGLKKPDLLSLVDTVNTHCKEHYPGRRLMDPGNLTRAQLVVLIIRFFSPKMGGKCGICGEGGPDKLPADFTSLPMCYECGAPGHRACYQDIIVPGLLYRCSVCGPTIPVGGDNNVTTGTVDTMTPNNSVNSMTGDNIDGTVAGTAGNMAITSTAGNVEKQCDETAELVVPPLVPVSVEAVKSRSLLTGLVVLETGPYPNDEVLSKPNSKIVREEPLSDQTNGENTCLPSTSAGIKPQASKKVNLDKRPPREARRTYKRGRKECRNLVSRKYGKGCRYYHPNLCEKFKHFGTDDRRGCKKGRNCRDGRHIMMCERAGPGEKCENESCNCRYVPAYNHGRPRTSPNPLFSSQQTGRSKTAQDIDNLAGWPCLHSWFRTSSAIVLFLNNGELQLNGGVVMLMLMFHQGA
eukprot:sb/3479469/